MTNVEIRKYDAYSPQTIGDRISSLARIAHNDGTFQQREMVGVMARNNTLGAATRTAMKAVNTEGLYPYVICRDEEIVGVATMMTDLELYKLRFPFVPAKIARKALPVLSEKVDVLGANVSAWTTAEYTREGVLDEAYSQIVDSGRNRFDNVWTIEPRMTSTFVTDAIAASGLTKVNYGLYDDGEITGCLSQDYGLYTA